jgi:hypothetical protein
VGGTPGQQVSRIQVVPNGTIFYIYFFTGLALRAASGVTKRSCLRYLIIGRLVGDNTNKMQWGRLLKGKCIICHSTIPKKTLLLLL